MHEPNAIFPGQHPDEPIVIFTRRHWIQFVAALAFVILIVAAYVGALFAIGQIAPLDLGRGTARLVLIAVSGIFLMMAWLFLYVRFIDFYLDVWILTGERIVQIKQRSLFNRQ